MAYKQIGICFSPITNLEVVGIGSDKIIQCLEFHDFFIMSHDGSYSFR